MEAKKITPKQIYVTRIRKKKREIEPDHWITETFSNVPAPTGDPEMDRVAQLLAERDNVTLQELAYLHPEDALFWRMYFQRQTGMTFWNFLKEYKQMIFYELLISTDLGPKEIEERIGFTYRNLSENFRKKYGLSPMRYRKKHRPENYRFIYPE